MIAIRKLHRTFIIYHKHINVRHKSLYDNSNYQIRYKLDPMESNKNSCSDKPRYNDLKTPNLKVRSIAKDLYLLRQKRKEARQETISQKAKFTFFCDQAQNASGSVRLSFDEKSYLFNCPPGYVRHSANRKSNIQSIEDVFLTLPDSDHIAGIFALLVTNTTNGGTDLCLHTPENTLNIKEEIYKFFQLFTEMNWRTKLITEEPFKNEIVNIEPIILNSSNKNHTIPGLTAYYGQVSDTLGHLDPQKCKQFGVPVGPLLGQLKSGKDITLANGQVVRSQDVCGPSVPGARFLIVDCPSKHYLGCLQDCDKLNQIIKNSADTKLDFVIHLAPGIVSDSAEYKKWMSHFEKDTIHLTTGKLKPDKLVHGDNNKFIYSLNHIDPVLFPMLHLDESIKKRIETESLDLALANKESDLIQKVNLENFKGQRVDVDIDTCLTLRPHKALINEVSNIFIDEYYREVQPMPTYQAHLSELRERQKNLPKPKDYEPEVVILGSGSSKPSRYRNVSSILVNFKHPHEASAMLDCGEDTYGQMLRKYGLEATEQYLKNLKFIFISHYHADHHLGLYQILEKRSLLTRDKVVVLVAPGCESLAEHYDKNIMKMKESYAIYQTTNIEYNRDEDDARKDKKQKLNTKLYMTDIAKQTGGLVESFKLVRVNHCPNSKAIVIKFNIGHKEMKDFTLAYSGDCRPSDDLVQAGQGCDLLIHEATFDPSFLEEAVLKRHSTSIEAIEVGRKMNAKYTLLTHFSQRFPRIPLFDEHFDDKVGFAFDYLTLKCPSGFPRMPILKHILVTMFEDPRRISEHKIVRKLKRKQRADVEHSTAKTLSQQVVGPQQVNQDVILSKLKQ